MSVLLRDIPQADSLALVSDAVDAVSAGANTYQAIARAIGTVERQGRYYRLAAEILGFIEPGEIANDYVLTEAGRRFAATTGEGRVQLLARAVVSCQVMRRVLLFLESRGGTGATRDELEAFLREVADRRFATTIGRRTSSVIAWLRHIGVIDEDRGRLLLTGLPEGVDVLEFSEDGEPLFPNDFTLEEYEQAGERVQTRRGDIQYLVDEKRRERAVRAHGALTDLVAARLRDAGGIPRANRFVDLCVSLPEGNYLFEMKSITDENARAQVRQGVSQLYEYRYLLHSPEAKLVLVVERELPPLLRWVNSYLEEDRGILLAWDGDGRTLSCSPAARAELSFLLH